MDRKDKIQRAVMLIDIFKRRCDDASFSAFRESLVEVGQQRIVDTYLTSKESLMRNGD